MEKGLELNPYGGCVANKMVNGEQCTLVWYVYNNKVLRMESKFVEDLIDNLKYNFGGLVVTRVKKNSFWGVNINITE